MSNSIGIGYARGFYSVDCRHKVTESQRSARFAVGDAEGLAVSLLDRKRKWRYERSRRMRIPDNYGAGAADYDVTVRTNGINRCCVFTIDKNGR